jgi:hypothetical protein
MGAQLGRARTGNCLAAGFGVGVATVPVGEAPRRLKKRPPSLKKARKAEVYRCAPVI